MADVKMSADEKRWRAESDANTLARAEEVKADAARHNMAKQHAMKEADRMLKAAGSSIKPNPPSKAPSTPNGKAVKLNTNSPKATDKKSDVRGSKDKPNPPGKAPASKAVRMSPLKSARGR